MAMTKTQRLLRTGALLTVSGAACLAAAALIGARVDQDGVLHEPFFLSASGSIALLVGVTLLACWLAVRVVLRCRRRRWRHQRSERAPGSPD